MDIVAIEDAIETLENSDPTVNNVAELANLYIVHEHIKRPVKTVIEREYDDILPAYKQYCNTKRRYQLNEVTEGAVIKDLKLLCTEIEEFLHILYVGTDMNRERNLIMDLLKTLETTYKSLE